MRAAGDEEDDPVDGRVVTQLEGDAAGGGLDVVQVDLSLDRAAGAAAADLRVPCPRVIPEWEGDLAADAQHAGEAGGEPGDEGQMADVAERRPGRIGLQ